MDNTHINFIKFDQPYYIRINEARWRMAQQTVKELPDIKSCLDVGCGPGWFSERLVDLGLDVVGLDGRDTLVAEATRRVPMARFYIQDITGSVLDTGVSPADLVFCFGLLYHLENPFAAIRNLHGLTKKFLFVETQIAPGSENNLVLVSEGNNETQGLHYHAFVPSRNALLKMLYVSGFHFVYRFTGFINHEDFYDSSDRMHRREVFLAAKSTKLMLPEFFYETEPTTAKINYSK
jgi:SAM-dependent methyltransferase